MASKSTDFSKSTGEPTVVDAASLRYKINQLKKQIQAERVDSVKEKIMKNKRRVENDVAEVMSSAISRTNGSSMNDNSLGSKLSSRIKNPLCLIPGQGQGNNNGSQDVSIHVTAKLPVVDKIPPYTTWTFLTRNKKMEEDESFIGKQRISSDQIGGETIVYGVSEEAIAETAEETHEFSTAEKYIIRMVCEDYEPSEEVLKILTEFIGGTTSEINEVYKMMKVPAMEVDASRNVFLEQSLTSALDSIDTLFCRLCLIFDCNLHGNSQPIISHPEAHEYSPESQKDEKACSDKCYKLLQAATTNPEEAGTSNIDARTSNKEAVWKPLEKDLYLKGLEMYGGNSCLITRNLLPGLKTCSQVYSYMCDVNTNRGSGVDHKEKEMASRSRLLGRKARGKKLKYCWKSSGHAPRWRRIADGKKQLYKQYTPCECKSLCGKDCPCAKISTCEKYCGCSKSCKNRFRGCHCAKSQCRSQQCPCFAVGRECDPDICRNCWVSCGGGSLGEPSKRGEGQCGNMRLLLRQKQRILLGKSDIAGWGAFLKNSVSKDEYLGEYTGELISHHEADVRGSLYDRINSSFLFNLNDEYVIDALRTGDKLKFANHSSKPNCYAKVMKVGGDHRVAIFAKEDMEAGTEIFYDYFYEPGQSPSWALKKPDASLPQGRGKKHQSHR